MSSVECTAAAALSNMSIRLIFSVRKEEYELTENMLIFNTKNVLD